MQLPISLRFQSHMYILWSFATLHSTRGCFWIWNHRGIQWGLLWSRTIQWELRSKVQLHVPFCWNGTHQYSLDFGIVINYFNLMLVCQCTPHYFLTTFFPQPNPIRRETPLSFFPIEHFHYLLHFSFVSCAFSLVETRMRNNVNKEQVEKMSKEHAKKLRRG